MVCGAVGALKLFSGWLLPTTLVCSCTTVLISFLSSSPFEEERKEIGEWLICQKYTTGPSEILDF